MPRTTATRALCLLCLGATLAGCDGTALGTPAGDAAARLDLASSIALDQSLPVDLRAAPADDLATPPDLSSPPDAGYVVCNLGNDPLPCTGDGTCAPLGARCEANRRACVCVTPNCVIGADQTCNSDPRWASLHGHCNAAGACQCLNGNMKEMALGKCL